ncbi:hypothetical protein [Sporomusa termitida]|uniref:hypothetical protein n=1 Tax=Sporomusa termitida TaxID=2377 RepID=UPI0014794541|nr:hypothetical protein [Sporomusa termitida]
MLPGSPAASFLQGKSKSACEVVNLHMRFASTVAKASIPIAGHTRPGQQKRSTRQPRVARLLTVWLVRRG